MRSVTATRLAHAKAERLWSVISTPGHLEACHPFCFRNEVERWPGVGSADTISYYGGRVVRRHFVAWEEGTGYDLLVATLGGIEQAKVQWRIDDDGSDASRLTVTLHPLFFDHLSRAVRWMPYLAVRSRVKRYLEAVVAGTVHYAETGEGVARNQFGHHQWFSPPLR